MNNGERDAEQDASGFFIVHPGERVDFDSTQKNAGGEICQWVNNPEWTINGGALPHGHHLRQRRRLPARVAASPSC